MDFTLTEDQKLLRERIIDFSRRELNSGVVERDRTARFPRELWDRCGELGLQGLPVPEELGGVGLDPLSTALALEAFGYGCTDGGLVFTVCAHLLACVVPVWKYGTEEQKARYLPGLAEGRLIAVNAMSEPGSGSDAFAMATRAVRNGKGYRLRGTKTFASNGPVADLIVVYARTEREGSARAVTGFLVEAGVPGCRPGQTFAKMGLRTSPMGELVFEDAEVGEDAVLGGEGGGATVFMHSMDWERVCLAAVHVGASQRLLESAVDYARNRCAFGKRIGEFQAVSHRIADMKVRLEAARLLAYRAAARLDRRRDVGLDAAMVKLFASEAYVRIAQDTLRILGGYGYMEEYEVERALRDAMGSMLYSGTSDIQRDIIAGWLGL